MLISWSKLAVGAFFGASLGVVSDWQIGARLRNRSRLRALDKEYRSLTGKYVDYRIRDDGSHEPTGGTIEIEWLSEDGLLEASGFHATGNPEWHSYIKMSLEHIGTGVGHYNNSNSIHGGTQQVVYSKQARCFNVLGTSHSRRAFSHCWRRADEIC